ncbi:putative ABC transport system ATP-binding protein [Pseudomonas asturiensis]|uniref:Putative ABC transport system ATP-binding protein n=1 Tax=Pseudomonas asturiensis TaxID=1190415 RepID=A0A1M7QFZ2_9PSED|nr:ABC transporter ATP-binding protein [Pseudomonas asturiensis]SHN29862.1 putative ABC transport system ATP-binding protein [Pseudomonas asturiensis]
MEPQSTHTLITMKDVCQSYPMAGHNLPVLRDVSLDIRRGQTCAILGTSGSGKSTLLNILGLLDLPTSGQFLFAGRNMIDATADERAQLRNREIGFVFQSFNLLPRLTALDNVALPLFYRGFARNEARECARVQIARVGLDDRAHHRPADLSGGQRQRVAIARALVGSPSLILADEPTGNLDRSTAHDVMNLLLGLNDEEAVTLVMVTHDAQLAERLDRCLLVQDGILKETANNRAMTDA